MAMQTEKAGGGSGGRVTNAVIDSDGHVQERLTLPPDLMTEIMERIGTDVAAMAAHGAEDPFPTESSGPPTLQTIEGGWDPLARLVDMDADGIDIAVLYPTTPGLSFLPDADRWSVVCRAYNDWLEEYCAAAPTRLVGVGIVPLQDPQAAVREMERSLERGFKAVMIRPAPYIGTKKLHDPVYDPFWDAAQAAHCPIGVHPFSFPDMPNVVQLLGLDDDTFGNPSKGLMLRQGLGNALDIMVALGWFVGGGICERFPNLTVAFLEGSGGWIAPMLERFDHHLDVFGSRYQTTPPSEIFKRQCYISFDPDEEALPFTANSKYVGAERIIWASDYPHPDAKIPGVVAELDEAIETLTADQRRLIRGDTAAALYDL
jgi:predicted TIM-barrel fold metal-dependent hydrolase